jgi:hypothetical protein
MKDCDWIAQLLQHGLLRGSFVPERSIRELRDLNRQRVALIGERNRVANRVQKVLEDANIKLASVTSDTLGLSGRTMLEALIAGEQDAERMAAMARGLLKRKADALRLALAGNVNDHHRFCLKQLLAQYDFLNRQILEFDEEIERRTAVMAEAISLLDTIPGIIGHDSGNRCDCRTCSVSGDREQYGPIPYGKELRFVGGIVPRQ